MSKLRLRTRLIWFVAIGAIVSFAGFFFYSSHTQRELYQIVFEEETDGTFQTVKLGLELGLMNEQFETVTTVFNWAKRDAHVKFIVVSDSSGEIIAQWNRNPNATFTSIRSLSQFPSFLSLDDSLFVRSDSFDSHAGGGKVFLGFSTFQFQWHQKQSRTELLLISFAFLTAGFLLIFLVSLGISRPLEKLSEIAQQITRGDLHIRADEQHGGKEIAELAVSFNTMVGELSNSQIQLQEQNDNIAQALEEVKTLNYVLADKNQNLEQLNQEKTEFLGIAAHDLKNPLTGISLTAHTLREYSDAMTNEQKSEQLRRIEETAHRMQQIIERFLNTNAIESGNLLIKLVNLNVVPIAKKVIGNYESTSKIKNISLNFNSFNDEVGLTADEQVLGEVLDNLISNAVKYSPHGKNILVSINPTENSSIRVSIKDEGPGLTAEDMKKLFGKYARLSAQPTGGEHSTGLGLSIVKKLVEAMNGKVWCESEYGHGATFFLELPAA